MRLASGPLALMATCAAVAEAVVYNLNPLHDTFIEGKKDNSGSDKLVVKEMYEDQINLDLIRRTFLEFDISELANVIVGDATLSLTLRGGHDGAVVSLCPAVPYLKGTKQKPIRWDNQPVFNCEKSLGSVEYKLGMTTMNWSVSNYIQQEIKADKDKVAFALIAEKAHYYTAFRSMEYKKGSMRPVIRAQTYKSPFNQTKFREVLGESSLQWPLAGQTAVSRGQFDEVANDHFQLVENRYLQVMADDEDNICAICQDSLWPVTTETERVVRAKVYLPRPPENTTEVTFLQIDSEFAPPQKLMNVHQIVQRAKEPFYETGPLLRIGWRHSQDSKMDTIWCTVRTSLTTNEIAMLSLFQRPEDFFEIQIVVVNSHFEISFNGENLTLPENFGDLEFWAPQEKNVFQAGIFLNEGIGPAIVQFDTLEMTPDAKEDAS